jgi:NADP-dependent 3-hydroxy acid dehydrogenase YdfG
MVNLNGRGYFLTTQAVLPYLDKPCRIVDILSASSRSLLPTQTVYAGTKRIQCKTVSPKFGHKKSLGSMAAQSTQ